MSDRPYQGEGRRSPGRGSPLKVLTSMGEKDAPNKKKEASWRSKEHRRPAPRRKGEERGFRQEGKHCMGGGSTSWGGGRPARRIRLKGDDVSSHWKKEGNVYGKGTFEEEKSASHPLVPKEHKKKRLDLRGKTVTGTTQVPSQKREKGAVSTGARWSRGHD